jgi:acetyl esterase/lipase
VAAPNWRHFKEGYAAQVGLADAKCAIRYLRAHAADYHIDPERIGAWGCSGGGWVASMLGVADASAGLEGTGDYQEQSSRVQAVVAYDAIANFSTFFSGDETAPQRVFGANSWDDPIVARLSPGAHLSQDDPPFLIFASDARDGVFVSQAEELYQGLRAAGIEATRTLINNADHCGSGDLNEAERLEMSADFFDQKLK